MAVTDHKKSCHILINYDKHCPDINPDINKLF